MRIGENFWPKNGGAGGGVQVHLGEGLAELFRPPSNTNVHPPIHKTKRTNEQLKTCFFLHPYHQASRP